MSSHNVWSVQISGAFFGYVLCAGVLLALVGYHSGDAKRSAHNTKTARGLSQASLVSGSSAAEQTKPPSKSGQTVKSANSQGPDPSSGMAEPSHLAGISSVIVSTSPTTDALLRADNTEETALLLSSTVDGELPLRVAPTPFEYDESFTKFDDPDVEEAFWLLDYAEPEIRAEVAWNLEPEGMALDRLLDVLANDPDPSVRVAVLGNLENADSFAALKGIVAALDDPDSEVVLEAIDSLEFAGDESNVRDLEPLLVDSDPRVSAAAREAIEFFEE